MASKDNSPVTRKDMRQLNEPMKNQRSTPKPIPNRTVKPSPAPSTLDQKIDWTEKEYVRLMKTGMNPTAAKKQAMAKYNIYPNGDTN